MHEMLDGKKALIFDMDGTLIDSMGVWKQIDIDYLANLGIELPDDLQPAIEGFNFLETAEYFKKRFSLPFSLEEIMATWEQMAYDSYLRTVSFKPGALEFLQWADKEGFLLGIATTNKRILATEFLKKFGVLSLFSCIITGDEIQNGKPNPEIYCKALHALSLQAKDCLVFEDILPGIEAGKSAGIEVCGVWDYYSDYATKEKINTADWYIRSFEELVK